MATSEKKGCLAMFFPTVTARDEDSTTRTTSADEMPYALRDDFLSPAEQHFYHALRQSVGSRSAIHTKIRLADIFYVQRPHENRGAFSKISQKHVDFLLCDPQSLQPICGIELDDSSHQRAKRQKRDAFVDELFITAGLPLIRIPVRAQYDIQQLRATLKSSFQQFYR